MKKTLILQAPAKINIGLWVKFKRQDGFHELGSIMQTISLHDIITVNETAEPGITVSCSRPGVPLDSTNLAHRAATVFFDQTNIHPAISFTLKENSGRCGLAGGIRCRSRFDRPQPSFRQTSDSG